MAPKRQLKRRKPLCVAREEVEEVPLGHEGDEFGMSGELAAVGDGKGFVAHGKADLRDLRVVHGEEIVEDS